MSKVSPEVEHNRFPSYGLLTYLSISYWIFVDTRQGEQVVSHLSSMKGVLGNEDVLGRPMGRKTESD